MGGGGRGGLAALHHIYIYIWVVVKIMVPFWVS